jgi:hypothetical protein
MVIQIEPSAHSCHGEDSVVMMAWLHMANSDLVVITPSDMVIVIRIGIF